MCFPVITDKYLRISGVENNAYIFYNSIVNAMPTQRSAFL